MVIICQVVCAAAKWPKKISDCRLKMCHQRTTVVEKVECVMWQTNLCPTHLLKLLILWVDLWQMLGGIGLIFRSQ